ncbi:hypothetical protein DFH11DRAFT_1728064 [Phellopilus nigrolimitatus]|nr:hypothetical protein DFH11DRAFT_1728064 [Phellopilus nigrolimitatus]
MLVNVAEAFAREIGNSEAVNIPYDFNVLVTKGELGVILLGGVLYTLQEKAVKFGVVNESSNPTFPEVGAASRYVRTLPLNERQDIGSKLQNARDNGNWIAFSEDFYNIDMIVGDPPEEVTSTTMPQEKATLAGWERQYVGSTVDELWRHILRCFDAATRPDKYVNICPIIQSSGTGKSRAVDQLSTTHFVLPFCLRLRGSSGFPPGDHQIREFLTREVETKSETLKLVDVFLASLFTVALNELKDLYDPDDIDYTDLARDFRLRMTDGQTMKQTNKFRKDFYDKVVNMADKNLRKASAPASNSQEGSITEGLANTSSKLVVDDVFNEERNEDSIAVTASEVSKRELDESTRVDASLTRQSSLASSEISKERLGSSKVNDTPVRPSTTRKLSYNALVRLEDFLKSFTVEPPSSPTIKAKGRKAGKNAEERFHPLVIIAFDEAAALTTFKKYEKPAFVPLRQELRALNERSLFSLFLSTTGQISAFASPSGLPDGSFRLKNGELDLNIPFTSVGFDLFAKRREDGSERSNNDLLTIFEVTSEWFMAHLGRALWASRLGDCENSVRDEIVGFAAAKLMNMDNFDNRKAHDFTRDQRFACLAQRLPFEFNSTSYLSRDEQKSQVENHMRICLKVDPVYESMVTLSASEPLLSEAAFGIMQNSNYNVEDALLNVLEGFSVHKGDRGEFLALLILIQARDAAVRSCEENNKAMWENMRILRNPEGQKLEWKRAISVSSFIGHLFNGLHKDIIDGIEKDFKGANIHFNHFIKGHEHKLTNRKYLMRMLARGAGLLCANNQELIDAALPFVINDVIRRKYIGQIVSQVKNDPKYGWKPKWELFDRMNQYRLKMIGQDDRPLPTIRIFFALASTKPNIEARRKVVECDNGSSYIAYDIWCAGLSSDFIKPIAKEKQNVWEALLDASYPWRDLYRINGEIGMQEQLQELTPCAATPPPFWENFYPLESDTDSDEEDED